MPELRGYGEYEAAGYDVVRRTCLDVATILGDLMQTDVTVVGGLVPSLLIPQGTLPADSEAHCGTIDVDLGLSLGILEDQLHAEVAARLREASYLPDTEQVGRMTRQRWRTPQGLPDVTIDFLIPRSSPHDRAGGLRHLETDLAATVLPGLQLVSQNWQMVTVRGCTLQDEDVECDIRVSGPAAFLVLKARALRARGRDKDAYDLFYVLRHYGRGVEDTATALRPLLTDPDAREALTWLAEDFATLDSPGPVSTAIFRHGGRDDALQADARGLVHELLRLVT